MQLFDPMIANIWTPGHTIPVCFKVENKLTPLPAQRKDPSHLVSLQGRRIM